MLARLIARQCATGLQPQNLLLTTTPLRRAALPVIDPDRCTGCGRCVAACPEHVLWLETENPSGFGDKHAVLHNVPGCTGCAKCVVICPFDAIAMSRTHHPHK